VASSRTNATEDLAIELTLIMARNVTGFLAAFSSAVHLPSSFMVVILAEALPVYAPEIAQKPVVAAQRLWLTTLITFSSAQMGRQ
jgi:hypothetical protein